MVVSSSVQIMDKPTNTNTYDFKDDLSKYTYQHIQGCLLLGLNTLASNLKLTHSEYRIMTTLIGYYNKCHGKAYPSTRQLVKDCCMSNTTLLKGLNKLNELGLIITVKDSQFRRQQYHINKQKLINLSSNKSATSKKAINATPCSSTHDIKLIETKTNKKIISSTQNDDVSFKTTKMSDYREILKKLNIWGYTGAKKLLKQKGIEEIKKLVALVEKQNPSNKGAYLRALINSSGVNYNQEIKTSLSSLEPLFIQSLLQHQFLKHIPTGKIIKLKPDIGSHLLIRYHGKEEMIESLDCGLIDKIENFEPVEQTMF